MKNHEQRPGKGVLFVNDKRKTDSQPHLKGGFMADRDIKAGEWVKLAGWRKNTQVGELISLAQDNFQPDPNYKRPSQGGTVREYSPFKDEEIPF